MARKTNVASLMMTFREAVFKFEVVPFYNTDDKQVLCDLEYIKDKYVYVFTTDPKNPDKYRLYNEYYGVGEGNFRIAVLMKYRGKNVRELSPALKQNLIVPVVVDGKKLEIFACLSRIQLPWKRIEEIASYPAARCYDLRAPKGGLCWIPNCVERNITELCGVRDSRIADPGNSVVMVGLYDHLREAERRTEQFRSKLDDYLQLRFDCNQLGECSEIKQRLQMKKYGAGLVLNLIQSNHPHVNKFRASLKNNGRDLEDFIREENKKEIRIRQEAEKAACSVARWIDDPDDVFEEVLDDYTVDPENQDHWDYIQEYYCSLLNRFNELSITRKYVSDKWKNKGSWMQKYLLNADAFQSFRKVTDAVAEFLQVVSEVACRKLTVDAASRVMEGIYRVWLEGVVFKVATEEFQSKTRIFLKSLSKSPVVKSIEKLYIDESTENLKKLGKMGDSKIAQNLLLGIEGVNLFLAGVEMFTQSKKKGALDLKSIENLIGSGFDLCIALGEKYGIDKGRIAILGVVSSVIDYDLAIDDTLDEYAEKDYDAMASKTFIVAGSATAAVGYGLVLASSFGSVLSGSTTLLAAANTFLMAGAGATLTGGGAPIGAVLILIGAVAVAAGTVAYFFTNDSDTEKWLKQSPWGVNHKWNFENGNYDKKLDSLHSLLYAFKADVFYDPWKKRAGIGMKSFYFQPETKIVIKEMVLNGGSLSEKIISEEIIVDELMGHPKMEIEIKEGTEITLTAILPHQTNLESIDSIEAKIHIDLFGNKKVMLPHSTEPLTCNARVYG